MHTFIASDGTVFKYNSDLSDVRINVPPVDIEDITDLTADKIPLSEVRVSGPALREFMADYFRNEFISNLESLDFAELFRGM